MGESAPDVVLAQEEDTSLTIGLCVSLPSEAGHQNLGNPVLGLHLTHRQPHLGNPILLLHLAHFHNAADKYLGPYCAKP